MQLGPILYRQQLLDESFRLAVLACTFVGLRKFVCALIVCAIQLMGFLQGRNGFSELSLAEEKRSQRMNGLETRRFLQHGSARSSLRFRGGNTKRPLGTQCTRIFCECLARPQVHIGPMSA